MLSVVVFRCRAVISVLTFQYFNKFVPLRQQSDIAKVGYRGAFIHNFLKYPSASTEGTNQLYLMGYSNFFCSFYNHKKQPTGVTLLKRIPSALKTYQLAQCSDSDRVKSYVMVKIGKTGTSTLIFMLARFMNTEGLSILRPSVGLFINWLKPRQQGKYL